MASKSSKDQPETIEQPKGPTDQQRARAFETVFQKYYGQELKDTLAAIVKADQAELDRSADSENAGSATSRL